MTTSNNLLLVPVAVEALVVNANDQWFGKWATKSNQYNVYDKLQTVEPHPFDHDQSQARRGITLRWSLPDALTRGRAVNGTTTFEKIPNRWLVIRTHFDSDPSVKAIVIESDYINKDDGTSPYYDSEFKRIGKHTPLEDWKEEDKDKPAFLDVLGPGEPAFSGSIVHNDDVLSFYDSLQDIDATGDVPLGEETFSYMVVGWYANSGNNPLASAQWLDATSDNPLTEPAQWAAHLDKFKWSLRGSANNIYTRAVDSADGNLPDTDIKTLTGLLPTDLVCHGIVHQVKWTGKFGDTQSGVPSMDYDANRTKTDTPHIAIGNSVNDALAAMLEYLVAHDGDTETDATATDIVKQLMAIESGQIDTYDSLQGEILLDQSLHKDWFDPVDGGRYWTVIAARSRQDQNDDSLNVMIPLTTAKSDALDELNIAQDELNHVQQERARAQDRLYVAWWKKMRLPHLSDTQKLNLGIDAAQAAQIEQDYLDEQASFTSIDVDYQTKVSAVVEKKNILQPKIDAVDEEKTDRQLDSQKHQLVSRASPRFFTPKDPTVIIFGGQQSAIHGRDGRFTSDGTLFCRFSDQTVTEINGIYDKLATETYLQEIDALKSQLTEDCPTDIIKALLREWVILDPVFLTNKPSQEDLSQLIDRSTLWTNDAIGNLATHSSNTEISGLVPSQLSIQEWYAPWSPLYMHWQVTFYPSSVDPTEIMSEDHWIFNPYDGIEYDWVGKKLPDHEQIFTMQGRALLARTNMTRLTDNLEMIAKLGEDNVISPSTLQNMRDQLESADLLAQTLTGFHDQLLLRSREMAHLPRYLEQDDNTLSDRLADYRYRLPYPSGSNNFYPVRGGHFRINNMWIVDSFGQVFDPIRARGQTMSSFAPLRGYGLSTIGGRNRADTQVLQLAPRIIQPSRLNFRFVSAEPRNTQVTPTSNLHEERGNPICGWLLPNHLDETLILYDAAGELLGSIETSDQEGIRWRSEIFNQDDHLASISNTYLKNMVTNLLEGNDADARKKRFKELLQVIDRTLWSSDPLGDRPQRGIAHLIGRPIAVVRARISLELRGSPIQHPGWSAGNTTADLETLRFPVQLGDLFLRNDGTLGYFTNDNFSKFYPTFPFKETEDVSGYLGFEEDFSQLKLRPSSPTDPTYLTILMDPRGTVSARTGILPTKTLSLPDRYIEEPLTKLAVTFRIGPILTEPENVRLPLPSEVAGSWRWLERSGVDLGIDPASTAPDLDTNPNIIRDGWLQLTGYQSADDQTKPNE